MKCFLIPIFCLLSIAVSYATTPAAMTVNGAMVEGVQAPATTYNGHSDSLNAPDSLTLLKNFVPEAGYEYILSRTAATGGGDTVDAEVRIDGYYNSVKISAIAVDSFKTAAAQKVLLPFGQTVFGTKYNVIIKTYAGDGGKERLNGLCVFKRRIVDFNKQLVY
jgi:hypothetical protein